MVVSYEAMGDAASGTLTDSRLTHVSNLQEQELEIQKFYTKEPFTLDNMQS